MPVGKVIGISTVSVIVELQVPSNNWSLIGGIDVILILFLDTKMVFKKELEELESRSVRRLRELRVVRCRVNESGSKRADGLRQMNFATQSRSMQPSAHEAVFWGLWTIFLRLWGLQAQPWWLEP